MAKKATTNRVHKIAKSLGVNSKDIVAKCKSEGIPNIVNYQSAVSAGLEATIMEWFSESGDKSSAVETAEKVDITKVKAKAKKKPKKKVPSKVATKNPSSKGKAPAQEEGSEKVTPQGRLMDAPVKAKMTGPRVIRIEKPEPEPKPRQPKRRPGPTPQGGSGVRTPQQQAPPPQDDSGRGSRRNKRRDTAAPRQTERGSRSQNPTQDKGDSNWRKQDLLERENRLRRSGGFFRQARRDSQKRDGKPTVRAKTLKQTGGKVVISEPISVKELSSSTGIKANEILRKLDLSGVVLTVNDNIETSQAMELMMEWGIELEVTEQQSAEATIVESFTSREMVNEQSRSPVVTILGHVDHGKTSLLDKIRKANVADGEAGGITQATSAFCVPVKAGETERVVTFIDTPGHEAFTEMRSRGAKVTDIVVLVVAADDGVMPQTIESINHAKSAGVPIVVALNKIDKEQATDDNIQRILGQLAEHDLNSVDWGGTTEVIRTSAIKEIGIQDLLDILDYQAELLELKADFGGAAEGSVIEAHIAEGRGPVANILVQQGKLKKGDFIVAGKGYGRIRALIDENGKQVNEAGPSTPLAILGLNAVPEAGDKIYVVKSLKEAESSAKERTQQARESALSRENITLDNIFDQMKTADIRELPVIVKGDVQGSIETLRSTIGKIGNNEAAIAIKHSAVGGINESDVNLAEACGGIIVGFNVTSSAKARRLAEQKGVEIRYYEVIYNLIDDLKSALEGLLDPEIKLEVLGHAEVREVFTVSKIGMIAGCYVTDGTIERNAQIRVTRDGIVVESDRKLTQLKRFKDDAKEVKSGQECGMKIEAYNDIKVGDVIECYKSLEVKRTL
ncbi:MAG: translation initiation factor IF-2 [Phycisphaerae bacterium]|nr:translation initiation factor IF-2 [Phycisphaerae bacterium]MBT6282547.1 translation initiation factor IF-2 [Phycisphaerae bacterium]